MELPAVTLEVAGGARLEPRSPKVGARFGLAGLYALDAAQRHVALGLGLSAGPTQSVNDVALRPIARGRIHARPFWLEADLGPSVHFISTEAAGVTTRRAQFSIDALAGALLTLGPYFAGLRAGALFVPAPAATAPTLPRWSAVAALIFGANVL
jgi:hypothetical protein